MLTLGKRPGNGFQISNMESDALHCLSTTSYLSFFPNSIRLSDAITRTNTHTHTHTQSSHSAVNEDSEQFASQRFQQLSIVELAQCNFHFQDVVFQN